MATQVTTSPASRPFPRHALGLPAGSIRALLALSVLALLWLIVIAPPHKGDVKHTIPQVFIYLQMLMLLIFAHYFSAHGTTIGPSVSTRSPLGLPKGSVRFLLLVGYGGLVYYLFHNKDQFEMPPEVSFQFLLTLITLILSAFFIGHYLTMIMRGMSGGQLPFWFQDFQAWIALLAMVGLVILLVIHLFINPTVSPDMKIGSLPLDTVLAALIGFYFGSRS